jgi:hypothetical protein
MRHTAGIDDGDAQLRISGCNGLRRRLAERQANAACPVTLHQLFDEIAESSGWPG